MQLGKSGIDYLGSLRFSLWVLAFMLTGTLVAYWHPKLTTWAMVVPLSLFAVNLVLAILYQPLFRKNPALMVFHLSLLAIVVLVVMGRLTYLKGTVGIVEGEEFSGSLLTEQSGPLHFGDLEKVWFVNEGFSIEYQRGVRRDKTVNRVRYRDSTGNLRAVAIGDQTPLSLHGYRFYTSFNKGFAPVFIWQPRTGEPMLGAVHLPSFPIHEYEQAATWTPPGSGEELWVQLQFDEIILDPGEASNFRVPQEHKLVVRIGEQRSVLKSGQTIELPGGQLVYQGVRTWMGYQVHYDRTIPWLLAACVTAVCSLAWHFYRKYQAKSWLLEETIGLQI